MTEEEFKQKVLDSTLLLDPQELIDYRFPLLVYYFLHVNFTVWYGN